MMGIAKGATMVALLAAGACMPVEEDVPPREGTGFTCNVTPIQSMIGQVATQQLGGEAVRASRSRSMRWIRPDSVVTMDYRPDRLNIHLDSQNRITRVACG